MVQIRWSRRSRNVRVSFLVSRKRKKKNWEEEDYYDSDDDTFLDRTGTVEKKREGRMKKAGKIDEQPETFTSLVKSYFVDLLLLVSSVFVLSVQVCLVPAFTPVFCCLLGNGWCLPTLGGLF